MTAVWLRRSKRIAGRVSWTAADQVMFALSNLLISLAVARGGGASALGGFSVAFAAYLVVLGLTRAMVSEPLLSLPVRAGSGAIDEECANTVTVLCGLLGTAVVGGIGIVLGRYEMVVIAAVLPVVLLQDILRYQAFRRGTPRVAALLDGSWLLTSLALWPVVTGTTSITTALICWASGAVVSIGCGWRALRPRWGGPRRSLAWLRENTRSLAGPLLVDSIVYSASAQALVFIVVAVAGDEELGTLRAGQVYFAPLSLLVTALSVIGVPYLAVRPQLRTGRTAARIALAAGGLSAIIAGGILATETFVNSILFKDAIAVPIVLLVPLAMQVVLSIGSAGPAIVTRARRRGAELARSRLSSTVMGIGLLLWLTTAYGVVGAAWALVGQAICYLVHLGYRVGFGTKSDCDQERTVGESVASRTS